MDTVRNPIAYALEPARAKIARPDPVKSDDSGERERMAEPESE